MTGHRVQIEEHPTNHRKAVAFCPCGFRSSFNRPSSPYALPGTAEYATRLLRAAKAMHTEHPERREPRL